MSLRKEFYRDHQVPPSAELHATKYVNGRTSITTAFSDDLEERKALGRAIAERCLETLASQPAISTGAVYRRTEAKGRDYHRERGDVYRNLVHRWDAEHRAADTYALVSMDGDGSDATYLNAHRSLPLDTRHVIEDPMMHDSKSSQWVQMADLVAYSVFTHLNRHPNNEFGWDWYERYIQPSDVNGGPLLL
ncbi:DUF3800 domain-containing protein [Demequina litorisediminis]|uniref:DUF3800 domain-containing protein n=1 Tax=Demequina litorisediminis TaxID=1849022 RepID=A0ABQ6II52_9MICO|nr:DUF3800 domain-containing protein [Demequina litorisediminis]GMA36842.1 hypothetical protein GCM10025876_30460 [Demequina litorisediminis]